MSQSVLVHNLDAAAIDGDDAFLDKCREGAYGIGCGHVRQVCNIFASHIDFEGCTIVLKAIVVDEQDERFGKSAANSLLGERDDLAVRAAQIL